MTNQHQYYWHVSESKGRNRQRLQKARRKLQRRNGEIKTGKQSSKLTPQQLTLVEVL